MGTLTNGNVLVLRNCSQANNVLWCVHLMDGVGGAILAKKLKRLLTGICVALRTKPAIACNVIPRIAPVDIGGRDIASKVVLRLR